MVTPSARDRRTTVRAIGSFLPRSISHRPVFTHPDSQRQRVQRQAQRLAAGPKTASSGDRFSATHSTRNQLLRRMNASPAKGPSCHGRCYMASRLSLIPRLQPHGLRISASAGSKPFESLNDTRMYGAFSGVNQLISAERVTADPDICQSERRQSVGMPETSLTFMRPLVID